MFCTKCGTNNSTEAQFCFKCGNKLSEVESQKLSTTAVVKPYQSPYEDEETVFDIRGRNPAEKRIFPKDKPSIPLLNSPHCDIFYTTRRMCLTIGDPNVKEPAPTKWFIPIGGGIGTLANLVLEDAINGYRKSQFKKKHGSFYAPEEIDIMCMAGNAIYSKGPLHIEIFKDKLGFFNTVGNNPKYMNIAFTGDYQYQDRTIRGSIIHVFTGDVDGTIKELRKLKTSTIELTKMYRNDIENIQYIESKL
jgi:hypothetical protein